MAFDPSDLKMTHRSVTHIVARRLGDWRQGRGGVPSQDSRDANRHVCSGIQTGSLCLEFVKLYPAIFCRVLVKKIAGFSPQNSELFGFCRVRPYTQEKS